MKAALGLSALALGWAAFCVGGCAVASGRDGQAVAGTTGLAGVGTASLAGAAPLSVQRAEARKLAAEPAVPVRAIAGRVDHSGRKQSGKASYYAHTFDGRKMASGKRYDPNTNVAASKTLPLGTVAKVRNTANGRTATVRIEDRGPHVGGRVVDVTPKVAKDLGMTKQGVAPVVVAPVTVPQPDGGVKLGAGAAPEGAPEKTPEKAMEAGGAVAAR